MRQPLFFDLEYQGVCFRFTVPIIVKIVVVFWGSLEITVTFF